MFIGYDLHDAAFDVHEVICDLPETASALKVGKTTCASTWTTKGSNLHL